MMKMYHQASHAGDAAFWEKTWNEGRLEEAIRFCTVDPLRPWFERYAPAGTRLLEGGCGLGQYVVYYSGRGVRVTGLDFSAGALRRLKARTPEAQLCLGDVSALPVRTQSHDVYYSGGVVEHFENGPLPALREAHRVLQPDGVLLVSVPYLGPLRLASSLWRRDRRLVPGFSRETASPRGAFWQYAFGVREFSALLEAAGFEVDRTVPYAIVFGLYDLPIVARMLSRRASRPEVPAPRDGPSTPAGELPLLKRLLVSEDRRIPLLGALVELAGRACANMMLYVCVRRDGPSVAEKRRG